MILRGKLFLRMFIGFWLVSIIILGSWMVTSNYFESLPPGRGWGEHRPPGPPHRFMLRLFYGLENQDDAALAKTVAEVRRKHDIEIYLVSRDGTDLLKRTLPAEVAGIAKKQLSRGSRRFINVPKRHLAAYRIYRPDGELVSAVFLFPTHRGFIMSVLGDSTGLRIALAILISGLVCFFLSRLMTRRLKDLQLASRRLANGKLDTRLQVREKGGDETDELARDFNSMAEQLQARVQSQKRLLSDVSHELRSPLARLRIALALAQEKPDYGSVYMQRIEQEAVRLEDLIGQLLATQERDLVLDTHIDLVSLLEQLCADANFEGQRSGKRFSFNSDTELAIVDSAGDLLHKSFDNILRNALQHTPVNSEVNVSLTRDHDCYSISIEDRGPGVPDDELNTIFREFYRVDTARPRLSGGYGLGLAIARRAILQHGGKVLAENTGAGLKVTVGLKATNPQFD
jgi:signal transduction histidine kinase